MDYRLKIKEIVDNLLTYLFLDRYFDINIDIKEFDNRFEIVVTISSLDEDDRYEMLHILKHAANLDEIDYHDNLLYQIGLFIDDARMETTDEETKITLTKNI